MDSYRLFAMSFLSIFLAVDFARSSALSPLWSSSEGDAL